MRLLHKIHAQVLEIENKCKKNHFAIRMEWVKLRSEIMSQIKGKIIKVEKVRHMMKRPNLMYANFTGEGMTPSAFPPPMLPNHLAAYFLYLLHRLHGQFSQLHPMPAALVSTQEIDRNK